MIGRSKPYTSIGIKRVKCSKRGCKKHGMFQWQCCALGNKWFALCAEHDVGLNKIACEFIIGRESNKIIHAYRQRVIT